MIDEAKPEPIIYGTWYVSPNGRLSQEKINWRRARPYPWIDEDGQTTYAARKPIWQGYVNGLGGPPPFILVTRYDDGTEDRENKTAEEVYAHFSKTYDMGWDAQEAGDFAEGSQATQERPGSIISDLEVGE